MPERLSKSLIQVKWIVPNFLIRKLCRADKTEIKRQIGEFCKRLGKLLEPASYCPRSETEISEIQDEVAITST
jgi:hypothetical protein